MPIDPSIALGVRPPAEQPNMLGQYAQVMALRAAQQEMEGNEGVRNALAGGVKDPYQLMQYGKQGRATAESILKIQKDDRETKKLDTEILKSTFDNSRYALGMVNDPEGLKNFSLSQIYDPVMGPLLKARGITPESIVANLDKEIATNGFANTLKKSAMGLEKFYQDQTSIENNKRTVGASYYSTNQTAQTAANRLSFEKQKSDVIQGNNEFLRKDPYGNVYPIGQYGAQVGPNATPAALPPAASSNLLATQANAQPTAPVNLLGTTPVSQLGAPTVANAAAIQAQQNVPRPPAKNIQLTEIANPNNPMETLRVNANTYGGKGVDDPGYIGVVKTGNLNPAQQQKLKTEMSKDYKSGVNVIEQTNDLLKSIDMVKDSDLNAITGQISSRTPSFSDSAQKAETRLANLKGKVTALGKASAALTGSIGPIATQEWKILGDQIAAIDPALGAKAMLEQIDLVESRAKGIAARTRDLYQRQYGEHFELNPEMKEIPDISYQQGGYKNKTATSTPPTNVGTTSVSNW